MTIGGGAKRYHEIARFGRTSAGPVEWSKWPLFVWNRPMELRPVEGQFRVDKGNLADALTQSPMRYLSRFFAPLIQLGARPLPDHVAPVFGSRYLGGTTPPPGVARVPRRRPKMSRSVNP